MRDSQYIQDVKSPEDCIPGRKKSFTSGIEFGAMYT